MGYSPRTTFDKLRTAEALQTLPELDHALTQGELTWSAARELLGWPPRKRSGTGSLRRKEKRCAMSKGCSRVMSEETYPVMQRDGVRA